MEKGDTVFFHPLLLHGSGPNRTKVKSSTQFFVNCKVYSRDSGRQFLVIMLIVIVILLM
jgi:ectoine hydroxylase-related dioxygenase (phytanoyl-CoA dioxygenase family)